MNLRHLFTEHPQSVGETYVQHLWMACRFSARMLLGGLACLVHAFLPFAFRHAGSACITDLYERMIASRVSANARTRRAGTVR